ncbi:hypothetical protein DEO72_LG9g3342 [Vigna unguiculata]|uniref:Uncharacterized protein n=1 Tax=Vigna unguiculata TaxID=3917 RepID=A0A4D6N3F6_VIGUN|nr:hypothetical protein DEO72_LG9g3342 [Vigna unguiculata]
MRRVLPYSAIGPPLPCWNYFEENSFMEGDRDNPFPTYRKSFGATAMPCLTHDQYSTSS